MEASDRVPSKCPEKRKHIDEEPESAAGTPSLAAIERMIQLAVAAAFKERGSGQPIKKPRLEEVSDTQELDGEDEFVKGRLVQGPQLRGHAAYQGKYVLS